MWYRPVNESCNIIKKLSRWNLPKTTQFDVCQLVLKCDTLISKGLLYCITRDLLPGADTHVHTAALEEVSPLRKTVTLKMALLTLVMCCQWWSRFRRTCLHQVSWIDLNSLMLVGMKFMQMLKRAQAHTHTHIRTSKCRPYVQTESVRRRKCGLICTNILVSCMIKPLKQWAHSTNDKSMVKPSHFT